MGATGPTCEPFGGQCPCRAHVIGRDCSRCATGYWGFPSCRREYCSPERQPGVGSNPKGLPGGGTRGYRGRRMFWSLGQLVAWALPSVGWVPGTGRQFWVTGPPRRDLPEAWGLELGDPGRRGGGSARVRSPQPVSAEAVCATSSRAAVCARHAPSRPTASCASPRPSAATPWWAVRSVTARGPVSRSSRTPPVTWTVASASEQGGRAVPHPSWSRVRVALPQSTLPPAPGGEGFALGGRRPLGLLRSQFSRRGGVGEAQPASEPLGRCRPNVAGRRCDTCAPGFHGYPSCRPCDCHEAGSMPSVCDPLTGQCHCKVRGQAGPGWGCQPPPPPTLPAEPLRGFLGALGRVSPRARG